MGAFFVYILKSAICLAAFYLFYRLLLSRETFHRFNRIALLGILLLSCLLPLLEVTIAQKTELQQTMLTLEQLLMMTNTQATEVQMEPSGLTGIQIALGIYLAGILFFVCRNLYSLGRLCRLLYMGNVEQLENGTRLVMHDKEIAPFSWMRCIVISRKDLEENGREILIHEQAHIRKRHSIDLLLADVCIFFQWFNPAAWLLKQELQNIHEYEADESVIKQGIDAKQYQLLLIKKAVGTRLYSMANSFNHSKLKKRITMMLKEKSSPWARLKYLYVLPLAAVAVTVFARPEISEKVNEISAVKVNDLTAIVETKLTESIAVDSLKPVAKDSLVFIVAEEMPQYPGGMEAMMQFIAQNVKYPVEAHKTGAQGRVIVQFVVDTDGKIISPVVVRSVTKELDAEAIRVIMSMPRWSPGKMKGKAVAVQYIIPVSFKLEGATPTEKTNAANNEIVVVGYSAENKEVTSLADGGKPLIIVDGKEMSQDEMSTINPESIHSIDVLKEASATAVYGEKGKNGVIIIKKKTDAEIASGNEIKVTGKVIDKAGKPVVGASILIEGTSKGTVSDLDGVFVLTAPKDATLAVQYIDKATAKVKVSATALQVTLQDE